MRITRSGIPDHSTHNNRYNTSVKSVAEKIFQTQTLGPEGYLSVDAPELHPFLSLAPFDPEINITQAVTLPSESRFDLTSVCEYERTLFTGIVAGGFSALVLTGEMGSGKSSTITYIRDLLSRPRSGPCNNCTSCAGPLLMFLDFNLASSEKTTERVLRFFFKILTSRLKQELRRRFEHESLVARFVSFVCEPANFDRFSVFDDFAHAQQPPEPLGGIGVKRSEAQNTNALFSFIDSHSVDDRERLFYLSLLVAFLRTTQRPDRACFVLILDNLDSVLPEAQFDLLDEILRFQARAGIQLVLSLRRSTFRRVQNLAAFSYGNLSHKGPTPLAIVLARLRHFADNFDSLPQTQTLDGVNREALRERLSFLRRELSSGQSGLEKIYWLSGDSIRHALFLSERLLVNSVISFDKKPRHRDEIFRAALYGLGSATGIPLVDKTIANIFADPESGDFSLICLRILQFVEELADTPNSRRVRNMMSMLRAIDDKWSTRTVLAALNHLLEPTRPLLWVDGKHYYKNPAQMIDCNDILYQTKAGRNYLSLLSCDLQYFQEATASVSWPSVAVIPVSFDYSDVVERMSAVRHCLQEVAGRDHVETRRFAQWLPSSRLSGVRLGLISNKMVRRMANSALGILEKGAADDVRRKGELKSWLSFLIGCSNEGRLILGRESQGLEPIRSRYLRVLGLTAGIEEPPTP